MAVSAPEASVAVLMRPWSTQSQMKPPCRWGWLSYVSQYSCIAPCTVDEDFGHMTWCSPAALTATDGKYRCRSTGRVCLPKW